MRNNRSFLPLFIAGLLIFLALQSDSPESILLAQDEGPVIGELGVGPTRPKNAPSFASPNEDGFTAVVEEAYLVTADPFTYLPLILKPPACQQNSQELQIANYAINHPNQGRQTMTCHPILAQVARERALDLGSRNYFSHVNPDGHGPNFLVRQAGYQLPSWWSTDPSLNYIESIAGGYTTAESAWNAWLNSSGHRRHVLAENDFWAEQTNFGIGYAFVSDSKYGHYWIFLSAPPEP